MTDRIGDDRAGSRYPMSLGDAIAALFRRKPKRPKQLDYADAPLSRPSHIPANLSVEGESEAVPVAEVQENR